MSSDGWYNPQFTPILKAIGQWQQRQGVTGHVAEIGVYRGASFRPICGIRQQGERALALDCFERQDVNSGKSGGMVTIAEFGQLVADLPDVMIRQVDSMQIGGRFVVKILGGECRLFSVDGDHSPAATLHDLQTAAAATCQQGVIVLDDVFNPNWCGVVDGLAEFLKSTVWRPVAYAGGRLALIRQAHWESCFESIKGQIKPDKCPLFFGAKMAIYLTDRN